MATRTLGAADPNLFPTGDPEYVSRTATEFTFFWSAGTYASLGGSGFAYDSDGTVVAGTITSSAFYLDGTLLVADVGGQVDAASIIGQPDSYLEEAFFAGDDVMYGSAFGDEMLGFAGNDTMFGSTGNDLLYGDGGTHFPSAGNDLVFGGDGNDTINGGGGADWLQGDAGNDTLEAGGGGTDILLGGGGNDTLSAATGSQSASIYSAQFCNIMIGGTGADSVSGGSGADWVEGGLFDADNDIVVGGGGDDTVVGGGGVDWLEGGGGNDTLIEAAGRGSLFGQDGDDWLWGAMEADTLVGGKGTDNLAGFGGDDVFVFDRADLQAGVTDTIHGFGTYAFGPYGSDVDTLRLTGGITAADLSYTDSGLGVTLGIALGNGQYAAVFAYGMSAAGIAGHLLFA